MANLFRRQSWIMLVSRARVTVIRGLEVIAGRKLDYIEDSVTGAIVYGVGQSYCERSPIMTGSGHLKNGHHRMLGLSRAYLTFRSPLHPFCYWVYNITRQGTLSQEACSRSWGSGCLLVGRTSSSSTSLRYETHARYSQVDLRRSRRIGGVSLHIPGASTSIWLRSHNTS